jgi:hypothetical protein
MLAHKSESDDLKLQTSDSDSGSTDQEDVPNHNTPAHQPPCECRARAPQFLPSDTEEDITPPQVIRPQLRPRPICAGQCQVEQATILFPQDTRQQTSTSLSQSDHLELPPREKTSLIGTRDNMFDNPSNATVQHELDHPITNTRGSNMEGVDAVQLEHDTAGPLMVFPGGEPSSVLMVGENVGSSEVQIRHSRQVAVKKK